MNALYGFLIGLFASTVAGMFGIGGSIATTPAIRVLLGASPAVSLGTPLPLTIPAAVSGAFRYQREGLLKWNYIALCASFGAVGSIAGSLLTAVLNLSYLMLATGLIILYVAVSTVYRGISGKISEPAIEGYVSGGESPDSRSPGIHPYVLVALTGAVGGLVSGLLGIGGGMIFVPSFLYILRMPIKSAFGNSLAVIALVAVPGTIIHTVLGHVSGWLLLTMLAGALPGGFLGASLSIKVKDRYLYVMFGTLLTAFGIIFIVNEIKFIVS
ncbi:MAG: sulfite exporter TauE/SafE family protein [Actinobacteria bacterium]|nr:sulfite exporter TauE/SafE family protein [Actinomycetota bacterium]